MMIKAEMFEDKALLLDDSGRVWQVTIGHDDQPIIQMIERVPYESIKHIILPKLAQYAPRS